MPIPHASQAHEEEIEEKLAAKLDQLYADESALVNAINAAKKSYRARVYPEHARMTLSEVNISRY